MSRFLNKILYIPCQENNIKNDYIATLSLEVSIKGFGLSLFLNQASGGFMINGKPKKETSLKSQTLTNLFGDGGNQKKSAMEFHHPHPPPESLRFKTKHVDDQLSAVKTMKRSNLLLCLEERLKVHKAVQDGHDDVLGRLSRKIFNSKCRIHNSATSLSRPSRTTAATYPDTDSVHEQQLIKAQQLSKHNTHHRSDLLILERELQLLKKSCDDEDSRWATREIELNHQLTDLRKQVAEDILMERELSRYQQQTRSFYKLRKRKLKTVCESSKYERNLMMLHDDLMMSELPFEMDPSNCVFVAVNAPFIRGLDPNPRREALTTYKRLLMANYKLGYLSTSDDFSSIFVFHNCVEAVAWASSMQVAFHKSQSWDSIPSVEDLYQQYDDCCNGLRIQIGIDCVLGDERVLRTLDKYTGKFIYRSEAMYRSLSICQTGSGGEITISNEVHKMITSNSSDETQSSVRQQLLTTLDIVEKKRREKDGQIWSVLPNSLSERRSLFDRGLPDVPYRPWWDGSFPSSLPRRQLFNKHQNQKKAFDSTSILIERLEFSLMNKHDTYLNVTPPKGVITILFGDAPGLKQLLESVGEEAKQQTITLYKSILLKLCELYLGFLTGVVTAPNGSFTITFSDPQMALKFSLELQRKMMSAEWHKDVVTSKSPDVYEYDINTRYYKLVLHGPRPRLCFNICDSDYTNLEINSVINETPLDPLDQPYVKSSRRVCYHNGQEVSSTLALRKLSRGGSIIIGQTAFNQLSKMKLLKQDNVIVTKIKNSGDRQGTSYLLLPIELRLREETWNRTPEEFNQESDSEERRLIPSKSASPDFKNDIEKCEEEIVLTDQQIASLLSLKRRLPTFVRHLRQLLLITRIQEVSILTSHDDPLVIEKFTPSSQPDTFVLTEIHNSEHLRETYTKLMQSVIIKHNYIIRRTIARYGGYEARNDGDAFLIIFRCVLDAVNWCCSIQETMLNAKWPDWMRSTPDTESFIKDGQKIFHGPRLRITINTGKARFVRDPTNPSRCEPYGGAVSFAARLSSLGRGGEIIVGFGAFSEFMRLNDERNGSLLSSFVRHSRGEVTIKGTGTSELIQSILPKFLAPRFEYWRKSSASQEAKSIYWTSATAKLEKALHSRDIPKNKGRRETVPFLGIEQYNQELLKRLVAMQPSLEVATMRPIILSEIRSVLEFTLHLYRSLLSSTGKPLSVHPRSVGEQERIANSLLVHFQYITSDDPFSSSTCPVPEIHAEIPYLGRKKSIRRLSRTKIIRGALNEKDARRLVREFQEIDADDSGTIHMNEIIEKGYTLGGEVFDDRMFKRFDKDRDGVLSVFEILREYFPQTKTYAIQNWISENFSQYATPTNVRRTKSKNERPARQSIVGFAT